MDAIIENLPEDLRDRLRARADLHRRSMAGEACAILTENLHEVDAVKVAAPYPKRAPMTSGGIKKVRTVEKDYQPFKGAFPLTDEFINRAKREGRE